MADNCDRSELSASESSIRNALIDRVHASGDEQSPGLSVRDYMALCLYDDARGYYSRQDPLGARGDFITSPEISQIFGELLGLWVVSTWLQSGSPGQIRLVELGPGRGTMMADMLRASRVVPAFRDALSVAMVEISPTLRRRQHETLKDAGLPIHWFDSLGQLPDDFEGLTVVVANEFLDAFPLSQFQWSGEKWHERRVMCGESGDLAFTAGPAMCDEQVPIAWEPTDQCDVGEWRDYATGTDVADLLSNLAGLGNAGPFIGVFIDYVYLGPQTGNTLQAVRRHRFEGPLENPGLADLTAHVDFSDFALRCRRAGLATSRTLTQSELLSALGLAARARQLMMSADGAAAAEIETGVHRLISPTGMGTLFKAVAVCSGGGELPPPFQPA